MSLSTPKEYSEAVYGPGAGRGDVERLVISTLRIWTIAYVADYERQNGLAPRALPVPPVPEAIHGGIDSSSWRGENNPELIVAVQPMGTIERHDEDGVYGSWYSVDVHAIVSVEGDPDGARKLADAYGTALQKLIPQQGDFGTDEESIPTITRTRLRDAYSVSFPDNTVRDVAMATVAAQSFVDRLVSDWEGPSVPPADPYAVPVPLPSIDRVEIDLLHGTPDDFGTLPADAIVIDETVVPTVTYVEQTTVDEPEDTIPKAD